MAIRWGGFGRSITGKTTFEEVLKLGKEVDESLAAGKTIIANLTKDEKRALGHYRNIIMKQ